MGGEKVLKIRELDPSYGDICKTMTLDEAKELDFNLLVTALPGGEVVNSYEELLAAVEIYLGPEIEILRFPPMAGG